jgi:hypothetical protein
MAVMSPDSIDDLFRRKALPEIHVILRQTREQVESKKRELRELVGDHYRSVLESSDHIRAMSDSAAKIARGADRVDGLIASMRQLAANPPSTATAVPLQTTAARAKSAAAEEDSDYRVGLRVMELLEIPESVREHLAAHEFVLAARVALLDANSLQNEIAELLARCSAPESSGTDEAKAPGVSRGGREVSVPTRRFDFAALTRQQATTFRGLPRQIVAACIDAFSTAALQPKSAAQGAVVHLLLEPSMQPVPMIRLFVAKRSELLKSLLDASSGKRSGGEALNCGARLASAAMAFEGTIVLGSRLCQAAPGCEPTSLKAALASLLEGLPRDIAAEERAAIEGRSVEGGSPAVRRRIDALSALLRNAASGAPAMSGELGKIGCAFVEEYAGGKAGAPGRSLSSRFGRLFEAMPCEVADDSARARADKGGSAPRTCRALAEILTHCSDKIQSYRHNLASDAKETWLSIWATACSHFCPTAVAPGDALAAIAASVEAACADVVRERVMDLQLELAPTSNETSDTRTGDGTDDDSKRKEEIREVQQQSRVRVARFDEMLGEIVTDMQHVARGGVVSVPVTAALLRALADRLGSACGAVHMPSVKPLWPADGAPSENTSAAQKAAARAAIALDTLMSAVDGAGFGQGDGTTSQLCGCLQTARDSGDAQLAAQARSIHESLKQYSTNAFAAWARLAVAPDASASTSLAAFWRLANDEVPPSCGWSHAKFANKGAQDNDSKPIPVPVQASPFVAERLTLGARRALEMCGSSAPPALISALKTAIGESLVLVYEATTPQLPTPEELKRSGMYHHLQWLFDLSFLRIALSAAPISDIGAAAATTGAASGAVAQDSGRAAYNEILALLERTEAVALSDPVDRTLYQPVLKSAMKIHVQEVRIILGPFFQHNSLYGVLFPALAGGAPGHTSLTAGDSAGDGFEIQQAAFALPLRSTSNLPRFPLLPFASASSLAYASSSDLDARLGLSAYSAQRATNTGAAAGASATNTGAAAVTALFGSAQQVGSAMGSLGIGQAQQLGSALGSLGIGQGLGLTKGWLTASSPEKR